MLEAFKSRYITLGSELCKNANPRATSTAISIRTRQEIGVTPSVKAEKGEYHYKFSEKNTATYKTFQKFKIHVNACTSPKN